MWSGSASGRCWKVSEVSAADTVVSQLGSLASLLRAQGSRVGVGELLDAHRALCAVDCASREDSRLALRTVLCSGRSDLERFDAAFAAVFGAEPGSANHDRADPLQELGAVTKSVLPRAAIPASGPAQDVQERPAIPAAWSNV